MPNYSTRGAHASANVVRVRLPLVVLACAGLVLGSCSSSDDAPPKPPAPSYGKLLDGAPPPLAALHRQAGEFLEGEPDAFRAQLAKLRGYPVVVNMWASWCGPCRAEFPYLQRQAAERGKEIAFIGVNTSDNKGDAGAFLEDYPVPFPHFDDPYGDVAGEFRGPQVFPTTAFYNSRGKLANVHLGEYLSEKALAADIDRYAR